MADNVTVENGAVLDDYTVASDDDGSAQHQYVKLEFGGDGTQTKVTSSVGLPVSDAGGSLTVDGTVAVTDGGSTISVDDGAGSLTVDGSVTADTELPAAAELADNTANPTVPGVGAHLMIFDGTTWDRWQGAVTATLASTTITANVNGTGVSNIAQGEASVTTSSASAVAARAGRIGVQVKAAASNTAVITIGASGVAAGTGIDLYPGDAMYLPIGNVALHADTTLDTQILEYIEYY